MKKFFGLCLAVCLCLFLLSPASAGERVKPTSDDVAEAEFMKTGPRLFTMEAALVESERTGKPVVCWMGKGIFKNAEARKLSLELGDTTIQATMDSDGTKYDKFNPRIKFSSSNYADESKTYFVPVSKFDKSTAEKVLRVSRGGK